MPKIAVLVSNYDIWTGAKASSEAEFYRDADHQVGALYLTTIYRLVPETGVRS
jgi:hypothetical protein